MSWLDDLARARLATPFANDLRGRSLGAIEGVITSVDDPEEMGRVRVALDSKGGDVESFWMPVANSIVNGKQADTLVDKRVLVSPVDGNMHLLRVVDILDTGTALSNRCPVYSDEIPECNEENLGSIIYRKSKDGMDDRGFMCMPSGWKTICRDDQLA